MADHDDDDVSDLSPEEMSEQVEREFRAQRMKRAKKQLVERASAKQLVESSLEHFVANAHRTDATPLPESREQTLARELHALEKRLADAEAQLAATARTTPRRWPHILTAFAVGAASMFAVSFAIHRNDDPPARVVEPAPAVAPPAPIVEPIARPTVEPIVEPAPAVAPVVEPAPPEQLPKVESRAVTAKKPPSKKPPVEKPETPKQDEKTGLYNPF